MTVQKIFIVTKVGGIKLFSHSLEANETDNNDDNLLTSFLGAINLFANHMNWPEGTLLIRTGNLECRLRSANKIFTVLFIENTKTLGDMTEPILGDLALDICNAFESRYGEQLDIQIKSGMFNDAAFSDFGEELEGILVQTAEIMFELYQKLILLKAMDKKVPKKWMMPLFVKIAMNEDIYPDLCKVSKKYSALKRVVRQVNQDQRAVWDLFDLELYDSNLKLK